MERFISESNVVLLWEVVIDEHCIDITNTHLVNKIRTIFDTNKTMFISKPHDNMSLMDLNKLFLKQVIKAVTQLIPNLKTENNVRKIKIENDEPEQGIHYTIEELHQSRQKTFDDEVTKHRADFEQSMMPSKPQSVNFADNFNDTKITEMDALLADTLSKRNTEINSFVQPNGTSDWLTPKETSLKADKMQQQQQPQPQPPNKHVTFESKPEIADIFDKLKKKTSDAVVNKEPVKDLTTNKYEEQISAKLPQIKQEVLKHSTPIPPVLIPNSELKTQLDMLSSKMDTIQRQLEKVLLFLDNASLDNASLDNASLDNASLDNASLDNAPNNIAIDADDHNA